MRARSLIANPLKLALVATSCLLFTACPRKDQPAPADTLLGDKSSPTRPGFISGNPDGYGPDGQPLAYGPDGQPLNYGPDGTPLDIDSSLKDRGPGSFVDPDGGIRNLVPSIFFDYDQSFIRQDQRSSLTETIDYLTQNASSTILVEGHCDFKGTTEYNLALGDRRAASVRDFLIDSGVDSTRVSVVSKGDLEAVQDGSDSQRAEDRRADIIIYN
ncbi:MAG: OmpA family protein [Verrucomicrobiota bacterium]